MTDKQIIIDGTQCRYASFDGGNTQRLLCAIDNCFCDCYRENECYYKQLKRKEQECEELKKQACGLRPELKYIIDKICSKYNINAKYYHEKIVEIINNLNQLKAEYSLLKDEYKILEDNLDSRTRDFEDVIDGYKQTLTEIKEIIEQGIKIHDDIIVSKQILQKISECEVEDDNN